MAGTLTLQVSLDGYHFAEGQFPPSMRIGNRVGFQFVFYAASLMRFRHTRSCHSLIVSVQLS